MDPTRPELSTSSLALSLTLPGARVHDAQLGARGSGLRAQRSECPRPRAVPARSLVHQGVALYFWVALARQIQYVQAVKKRDVSCTPPLLWKYMV